MSAVHAQKAGQCLSKIFEAIKAVNRDTGGMPENMNYCGGLNMFDIMTGVVLFLSTIYEGWKLYTSINTLIILNDQLGSIDADTAAYIQLEAIRNNSLTEIIILSALLILTLICLIRFIRWAIIGYIMYMTHNTTKDFLKTTNGNAAPAQKNYENSSKKRPSAGGMRITNHHNNNTNTEK